MIFNNKNKIDYDQYVLINSIVYSISNPSEQIAKLIKEYFSYIIQVKPSLSENRIAFNSFSDFFTLIFYYLSSSFMDGYAIENIARLTALNFRVKELNEDNILIRYGENMNPFLLILEGEVEVFSPIVQEMKIYKRDYYRYLAYLMELGEYELINRVLIENISTFQLEIMKTNGFGRIPFGLKVDLRLSRYISPKSLRNELNANEKNNLEIKKENNLFTSDDYLNLMSNIQRDSPKRKDKLIIVKVLGYKKTKTLRSGDYFGYEGLIYADDNKGNDNVKDKDCDKNKDTLVDKVKESDNYDKICSMYCTSKKTQFAYLTKNIFDKTLKPVMKSMLEKDINFLHSHLLFKHLSLSLFERKYFHLFIKKDIKKGYRLIKQNTKCNYIYFLRPAEYQITVTTSIKDLLNTIILFYKTLQSEDTIDLKKKIKELVKEENRIGKKVTKCPLTKHFYNNQSEYNIITITNEEVIGLNYLCPKDSIYLFNLELKSSKGEYYQIEPELYENIKKNETIVNQKALQYNEEKTIMVINKLIETWNIKVKLYYKHNKETMRKIHQLVHPTHQLKEVFTIPKRKPNYSDEKLINSSSSIKGLRDPRVIDHSFFEKKLLPYVDEHNLKTGHSINKRIKTTSCVNISLCGSSSPHDYNTHNKEPMSFKQMVFNTIMNKERKYFLKKKKKNANRSNSNLISHFDTSQDSSTVRVDNNVNQTVLIHKNNNNDNNYYQDKKVQLNNKLYQQSFFHYKYKLKSNPAIIKNYTKKSMIMNHKRPLRKITSQTSIYLKEKNCSFMIMNSGNKSDCSYN